jgi:hypothetical protein
VEESLEDSPLEVSLVEAAVPTAVLACKADNPEAWIVSVFAELLVTALYLVLIALVKLSLSAE